MRELLLNGHTLAAELTGIPLFGINEEEVENLSVVLAKLIASRGGLPKAAALSAKHGPWTNFVLVLATIYGPRLVMLWKMWEAERARQKKHALSVMPPRGTSDPEIVPGVDPDKAVN